MTLRSMHDAVQTIGRAVGIADLAPNAAGAFELVFFDQLPVYFQEVGDSELEVQLRLGDDAPRPGEDLAKAMLQANLDLRRGRLAMEPGSGRLVYCGRVNIAQHDAGSLMQAVSAIIREGAEWRMGGLAALAARVAARQSTESVLFETLIRV